MAYIFPFHIIAITIDLFSTMEAVMLYFKLCYSGNIIYLITYMKLRRHLIMLGGTGFILQDDNDVLRRSPGTPVFTAPECCLG